MNFYKNTPRSVHISNEAFEGRVLLEWGGGVNYSKIPFFLFQKLPSPQDKSVGDVFRSAEIEANSDNRSRNKWHMQFSRGFFSFLSLYLKTDYEDVKVRGSAPPPGTPKTKRHPKIFPTKFLVLHAKTNPSLQPGNPTPRAI